MGVEDGGGLRSWLRRVLSRKVNEQPNHRLGRRATSQAELQAEAVAYIRSRLYGGRRSWREGLAGLRHKTFPVILGVQSSLSFASVVTLFIRVAIVICAAFLPVISRKLLVSKQPIREGFDGLFDLLHGLTAFDYVLGALGALLLGVPKALDAWTRRRSLRTDYPYTELSAAMEKMPALGADADPHAVQVALTHALNALRIEMSTLIGDPDRKRVTDVTLLQYCEAEGLRMQVTARTAITEPTHRPREAFRFLANYVAREGTWFAEHDFLSSKNPFKPLRLTVTGTPRVGYRSVLYLPILTARRAELPAGQFGPVADVEDRCIGVICVHSAKPYRFWRWGDHLKDNGGGFGNVALEKALPYISLITKLVENTAFSVAVERADP